MTADEKNVVKEKEYRLVPPDGGWGYVICAASVINFTATTAFIVCFGLLYNDFLIEIGVGSTGVTLINGLTAMSNAFGGYLSSPLLKVMSLRKVLFLACTCYNCGVFFLVFTYSAFPFYICQGILQGFGLGLTYNLTLTVLNEYFFEKRLFASSIVQALTATFGMFAPQFVKISMDVYGYRGMLLLTTGITLQAFVGTALMQPVSWHMKKVEIPPEKEESELLLSDENKESTETNTKSDDVEKPVDEKIKNEDCKTNTGKNKSAVTRVLLELFDIPTLKIFMTSLPLWGCTLTIFADVTYTLMMPQALYANGWEEGDVALAVSLAGFGDLAARASFILLSKFLGGITNQELYVIGLGISVISKIGMLHSNNPKVTLAYITILGIPRCFTALISPLVITEIVGPDKFTMAMGIFLMTMGLVNIILGPAVGAVRDYTESYYITFCLLTIITFLGMVVWAIRLIHLKRQSKNKTINSR